MAGGFQRKDMLGGGDGVEMVERGERESVFLMEG